MASDRFDHNFLPFTSSSMCVVHKILPSNILSMVIWPQNQLRADSLLRNVDKAYIATHPLTHILVNLPDSGRHVTRVNQGLFSTTMEAEKRDPGNEVDLQCPYSYHVIILLGEAGRQIWCGRCFVEAVGWVEFTY